MVGSPLLSLATQQALPLPSQGGPGAWLEWGPASAWAKQGLAVSSVHRTA
jgi:hypothetical protein